MSNIDFLRVFNRRSGRDIDVNILLRKESWAISALVELGTNIKNRGINDQR